MVNCNKKKSRAFFTSYTFAALLSISMHLLVFILFFIHSTDSKLHLVNPPNYIQARLTPIKKTSEQPIRHTNTIKEQAIKKKQSAVREAAAIKKKKLALLKKQKQLKKKKQQEQAALQKKEKIKQAQIQAERQKKRVQQRELREQQAKKAQQLIREKKEKAIAAAQARQIVSITEKYTAILRNDISAAWSRPPSTRKNMIAVVEVQFSPFGDVLGLSLMKKSGNDAFDRSVTQAIRQAAPFTELKNIDRSLFEKTFRQIIFTFSPEDLSQ